MIMFVCLVPTITVLFEVLKICKHHVIKCVYTVIQCSSFAMHFKSVIHMKLSYL